MTRLSWPVFTIVFFPIGSDPVKTTEDPLVAIDPNRVVAIESVKGLPENARIVHECGSYVVWGDPLTVANRLGIPVGGRMSGA